jgi:hypothetical protein
MAGDSRYFPARDRGPVREFVRDYVDARRSAGEFFVVGAVIVMVLGLVRVPVVQQAVVLGWTATLALVIVDTTYLGIQLTRALRRFERAQRRGAMPYGLLRALQMRRFRIPPPRVGPGGRPVTPRTRK